MILLTPGPCMTSETVRAEAARPDLNHRDPEYLGIQRDVRSVLSSLFGGYVPHLIGGSGTAAMEATVTSCINEGPCLIVSNGYYAERYRRIFEAHEIAFEVLAFPWSSAWDMGKIGDRLADGEFEAVLATHHETSTGRLNDVSELAALTQKHKANLFVDAVSSLGAEALSLSGVHGVFSSANKCFHGLPGVSFVMLEPTFATKIKSFSQRSYYLHLPMYEGERPPLTPPIPSIRAFRQALTEFQDQGGLDARHARYSNQALRIRTALREAGCGTYVPDSQASCAVTVATVPRGFVTDTWLKANYEARYVLFECKGDLRETHFQVSTMGEVTDEMVAGWLATVQRLTS